MCVCAKSVQLVLFGLFIYLFGTTSDLLNLFLTFVVFIKIYKDMLETVIKYN